MIFFSVQKNGDVKRVPCHYKADWLDGEKVVASETANITMGEIMSISDKFSAGTQNTENIACMSCGENHMALLYKKEKAEEMRGKIMDEATKDIIQGLADKNTNLIAENSSLRGKLERVSQDLRARKRLVARLIEANTRMAREARERKTP